ncbi:hypothetical protein AB6A40_003678 [Gnathostoma spinigerum]|uniref:Neurotransmitter-gated ion-channel transmembrane domain-containing protein n=1 Tax=Gnathostoma spinigerum TaxID=75299 RepID=A0ABD6EHZ8_9BILA
MPYYCRFLPWRATVIDRSPTDVRLRSALQDVDNQNDFYRMKSRPRKRRRGSVQNSLVHRNSTQKSKETFWTSENIDRICQFLFPLAFISFNCFYWIYYTAESERQMERLLDNANITGSVTPL